MSIKASLKQFIRKARIFRCLLILYRLRIALRYSIDPAKELGIWLFKSRETTNFTYHLENRNKRYLAAFIAQAIRRDYQDILNYIVEIESDDELKRHIQDTTRESGKSYVADVDVRYGRRVGWYALIRAIKPKVVIETGVDKGLGACVLTAALFKNNQEGYKGYYYGTDINPEAGYLLRKKYAEYGEILYGDSVESLEKIEGPIDVFINDSDHSAGYEAAEYEAIRDKLGVNAVVLGDNSHVTDSLFEFALQTGRHFLFFQEKPYKHWYPGGGIGIAFSKE